MSASPELTHEQEPADQDEHTIARLQAEIARLQARVAEVESELETSPADTSVDANVTLLESLLDTSAVGIGFLDTQLRYQRVNRALIDINGRTAEEHLGRTVGELFPEVDDELGATMRQVLETGESVTNIERTGATLHAPS